MGCNGIAGQSGLSTWITHRRRKQCNGRTTGASTQGIGSTAATQSRATCLQSQRRAGPLAPRRPLAIQRRVAASRAARMIIGAKGFRPWRRGDRAERRLPLMGTFRTLRDVRLESGMRTKADVRAHLDLWVALASQLSGLVNRLTSSSMDNFRNCGFSAGISPAGALSIRDRRKRLI